ncbi:SDR family NAD(P)-dependent oxidoreductase [Haloarchaeobius sp. DFWS5]|uniref:SDR family NAD(P)-dependent oxidoreductase n=1 Tax=Haloarchaeobius sp. DFWS5 TaxID=3446114 RepID=UPI003EB6B2B1
MTNEAFDITGETAVVTGSSTGIGRAIAERYAENGVDVVVCSREQENVDPVADTINDRDGGRALAVECDIREWDTIEALVETTEAEFGPIDVLVNNAGASFQSPFEELSQNGWRTIVDINLNGLFNCSRIVGERMIEHGGGTILNISSVAGRDGAPQMTPYAASKAGMNNLTWTLAYEWAKYGVRVNGIAPGLVATEGLQSQMGISAADIDVEDVDREIGLPDEVATVAQFLASPAARYILGQTIVVEGVPRLPRTSHHGD